MTETRSTLVVDGDVTAGKAAIASLNAAFRGAGDSVGQLGDSVRAVEAETKRAAAAAVRVKQAQKGLAGEAEEQAAAISRAVAARKAEARAVEHEAAKLKILGAEQGRIATLQQRAIELRTEAAAVAGREGEVVKLARQRELELARSVASERRASEQRVELAQQRELANERRVASERRAAMQRARASEAERIKHARQWAAEERQTATEVAAAERERVRLARQRQQIERQTSRENKRAGRDRIRTAQSVVQLARDAFQLAQKVVELADEGVETQNVSNNLQLSIDGARSAFKGYVGDVELARIANQAFELGVVDTGEELEALARGVQVKAERLGTSSTQLFENAVTAIGRGSALILDNLGIILNQAKAEEIYAKSLGLTVKNLTALQREEAFQKAALIEIAKAGEHAARSADGWADAVKRGAITVKNARSGLLGFDDEVGRMNEALRGLTDAEFENLKFGEVASDTVTAGRAINKALGKWQVDLNDLREAAERAGLSYQDFLDKTQGEREARAAAKQAKAEKAHLTERADLHEDLAKASDHEAAKMKALGMDQSFIIGQQIRSLQLRQEAARAAGDEAAQLEISRNLELARIEQSLSRVKTKSSRGGGRRRDPNEALERERDAVLRVVAARSEILAAELGLERSEERRALRAQYLIERERELLDVREQAARASRVKGADQRDEREAELLEIVTQRRLLDLEAVTLIRAEEQRAAAESIASLDRRIERLQAMGVATQLLEQRRLDASVSFAETFGTEEEAKQAAHEADLIRIDAKRQIGIDAAQAQLDAHNRATELAQARGESVEDQAARRLELEAQVAAAELDHDKLRGALHKREVARAAAQTKAQQKALTATQGFLSQGQQFAGLITEAAIKDEEKRAKANMKARGIEALARGALETVEAVAAFARYDFVGGALHTAAAAVAFTQGGMLLAGKVGGGAAGGASAPAEAPHQTVVAESGQAQTTKDYPTSAEKLAAMQSGSTEQTATPAANSGGTVINISGSTMVAGDSGGLFNDVQEQQYKAWGTR